MMLDAKVIVLAAACVAAAIGIGGFVIRNDNSSDSLSSEQSVDVLASLSPEEQAEVFSRIKEACTTEDIDSRCVSTLCPLIPYDATDFSSALECPSLPGSYFNLAQAIVVVGTESWEGSGIDPDCFGVEYEEYEQVEGTDETEPEYEAPVWALTTEYEDDEGAGDRRLKGSGDDGFEEEVSSAPLLAALVQGVQDATEIVRADRASKLRGLLDTKKERTLLSTRSDPDEEEGRGLKKKKKRGGWKRHCHFPHRHNPHRHNPHVHAAKYINKAKDRAKSEAKKAAVNLFNAAKKEAVKTYDRSPVGGFIKDMSKTKPAWKPIETAAAKYLKKGGEILPPTKIVEFVKKFLIKPVKECAQECILPAVQSLHASTKDFFGQFTDWPMEDVEYFAGITVVTSGTVPCPKSKFKSIQLPAAFPTLSIDGADVIAATWCSFKKVYNAMVDNAAMIARNVANFGNAPPSVVKAIVDISKKSKIDFDTSDCEADPAKCARGKICPVGAEFALTQMLTFGAGIEVGSGGSIGASLDISAGFAFGCHDGHVMLGMPVGYGVSATASVNAGVSGVDASAGVDVSLGWVAAGWEGMGGYGMGFSLGGEGTFMGVEVGVGFTVDMELPTFSFGCTNKQLCKKHQSKCMKVKAPWGKTYKQCASTKEFCNALRLNSRSKPWSCENKGFCASVTNGFEASGSWEFAGVSTSISMGGASEAAEVAVSGAFSIGVGGLALEVQI